MPSLQVIDAIEELGLEFPLLEEIHGDLHLSGPNIKAIQFPRLIKVNGSITVRNINDNIEAYFDDLTEAASVLVENSNLVSLVGINLNETEHVHIVNNPELVTLEVNVTFVGSLRLDNLPSLGYVRELEQLRYVSQDLLIRKTALKVINSETIQEVGNLTITKNSLLTNVTLHMLRDIYGSVDISDNCNGQMSGVSMMELIRVRDRIQLGVPDVIEQILLTRNLQWGGDAVFNAPSVCQPEPFIFVAKGGYTAYGCAYNNGAQATNIVPSMVSLAVCLGFYFL